jgi:hypothetical protein
VYAVRCGQSASIGASPASIGDAFVARMLRVILAVHLWGLRLNVFAALLGGCTLQLIMFSCVLAMTHGAASAAAVTAVRIRGYSASVHSGCGTRSASLTPIQLEIWSKWITASTPPRT